MKILPSYFRLYSKIDKKLLQIKHIDAYEIPTLLRITNFYIFYFSVPLEHKYNYEDNVRISKLTLELENLTGHYYKNLMGSDRNIFRISI